MVTGDAEGRAEMPGTRAEGSGRYPREQAVGVSNTTVKTDHSPEEKMVKLMEAVVERENMRQAYSRVMRNKGAAGVDEMPAAPEGAAGDRGASTSEAQSYLPAWTGQKPEPGDCGTHANPSGLDELLPRHRG